MKIGILGAQSTGKSQLAHALGADLRQSGKTVRVIEEYLREWCDLHGRTPHAAEQLAIAQEQARRVEAAAGIVIADTTPLMTAVYSEHLFGDTSLCDFALAHQRQFDVTLVTGLDLPWVPDGLQRDGPHAREPVDALLRAALQHGKINYQVVYGAGTARLANAQAVINSVAINRLANYAYSTGARGTFSSKNAQKWRWPCDKCSDGDCEHRLFTELLKG